MFTKEKDKRNGGLHKVQIIYLQLITCSQEATENKLPCTTYVKYTHSSVVATDLLKRRHRHWNHFSVHRVAKTKVVIYLEMSLYTRDPSISILVFIITWISWRIIYFSFLLSMCLPFCPVLASWGNLWCPHTAVRKTTPHVHRWFLTPK